MHDRVLYKTSSEGQCLFLSLQPKKSYSCAQHPIYSSFRYLFKVGVPLIGCFDKYVIKTLPWKLTCKVGFCLQHYWSHMLYTHLDNSYVYYLVTCSTLMRLSAITRTTWSLTCENSATYHKNLLATTLNYRLNLCMLHNSFQMQASNCYLSPSFPTFHNPQASQWHWQWSKLSLQIHYDQLEILL